MADMADDMLSRLEAWKHGHKSRSVDISHDAGYGSGSWVVVLCGNGKRLRVGVHTCHDTGLTSRPGEPEECTHAVHERTEDWDDWPGVHDVLGLALAKAEEYGL